MAGLGFAIGMVDTSMMPELATIVDKRHNSVYGGVYAIGDVAFCFGFAIGTSSYPQPILARYCLYSGPAISGSMMKNLGFSVIVCGLGLICFAFSPFLSYIKSIPDSRGEFSVFLRRKCRRKIGNFPKVSRLGW